jgi:hypothetical protein
MADSVHKWIQSFEDSTARLTNAVNEQWKVSHVRARGSSVVVLLLEFRYR